MRLTTLSVWSSTTQSEVVHECIGGNVGVYGIGATDLADPCVLNGIYDEGATTAFGGFVELEIISQQLMDGLGARSDEISGVIWDSCVDRVMCERYKLRIVTHVVHSVEG